MLNAARPVPLWTPAPAQFAAARMTAFARLVHSHYNVNVDEYADLHAWSIAHLEDFWRTVWDYSHVIAETRGERVLVDAGAMPGARFFPDARLNFAENLLRRRHADDDADAIVFWAENKTRRRLSHRQLYDEVSRVAQALRRAGVQPGDRIAGFLPNMPETVIAALAGASIGATWTSCSSDFGLQGVLDRFGQVEPTILFAGDGYYGAGKAVPTLDVVRELAARLPRLRQVVIVPCLEQPLEFGNIAGAIAWDDWLTPFAPAEIEFAQLPFNHPLYIMYSSGTTGVPKCIVHSAGGALLMHLKEHQLHCDIRAGDRVFFYTTCGWMMWNWLITALASGATLLLYDGSPFVNRGSILFDLVDDERATHCGVSAKFIDAIAKLHLAPMDTHRLDSLRMILSTGSPLAPEGFDYVYQHIKRDVCLASISGGTDLIALFAGGSPTLPVYRGEIQCRALGMAVDVFDDAGQPVRGRKGELVCTRPFPTMPLYFWNDPDNKRYRRAYFERFPNVWHHGDYCELIVHANRNEGLVIHGRSDAVLNPGGVRIGTAEIYRQVEKLDEVEESLVIGQDWPPGKTGNVRVVLFVRLRPDISLDDALIKKVKRQIRVNTTPHHVPAKVVQVSDIPRTKSGKIVELAVRNVVHGAEVKNIEALANPEALLQFAGRAELAS
ncbi:MAG TPA: acetoacetate--CoA ligase [Usitatibacteraceae bacterium]